MAQLQVGAPPLALARELLRGERRAVDAVAPGTRSYHQEHVADAVRRRRHQVPLAQQSDAHGVDERIAGVAGPEVDFTAQRRDAHAVAVVSHALDDPGAEVAVARVVERAEAQAVEHRHWTRAHGEHIAQDPAHAPAPPPGRRSTPAFSPGP